MLRRLFMNSRNERINNPDVLMNFRFYAPRKISSGIFSELLDAENINTYTKLLWNKKAWLTWFSTRFLMEYGS